MHDPLTVAFEVKSPIRRRTGFGAYRAPLITVWHKDPCRDGTDDSCGWFARARHGDKAVLEKIVERFESDWDRIFKGDSGRTYYCGWFKPNGDPHFSPVGITVGLFRIAAALVFGNGKQFNWSKADRFVRNHLADIIWFAENPTDSLHDAITRKFEIGCGEEYTDARRKERIKSMASCIYGWILRAERPWYRHPRWHFWHWRFQVHPWQTFRRWAFERCVVCRKGYRWGYCPTSNWGGTATWHHECDRAGRTPR